MNKNFVILNNAKFLVFLDEAQNEIKLYTIVIVYTFHFA